MFAIPLLVISGCGEETKEEIADVLLISQDEVAFPMEGGTSTISVACPSQWHSTVSDQSWITATEGDGNVMITVTANETGDSRKATVTLESATTKKEIKVSQSWSGAVLSLKINGPESMELDSEGDSFMFSVETNDKWDVKSDASWLTVSTEGKLVKVNAAANEGAHRDATITVTASAAGDSQSKEIKISQISREENTYYNMLGYFGLSAENWYLGNESIGRSGIGSFCTIEEKEYGKSFIIKDLFVAGTEIGATYDQDSKQMVIDLGGLCRTVDVSATETYYYYLVQTDQVNRKFASSTIRGTLGTGYNEIAKEDRTSIKLGGFMEGYNSLGLIVRTNSGYALLSDVFYANGEMYLVKADKTQE